MFSFRTPSISQGSSEAQMAQMVDYITQLLEALEFAFNEVSDSGVVINDEQLAKIQERIVRSEISISDVIGSNAFKDAVREAVRLKFTVNYDTGNLEYTYL